MSITLISLHTVQKNLQKIALLAQTSEHPTGMTVEEVVSYGRYPYQNCSVAWTRKIMKQLSGRWMLQV